MIDLINIKQKEYHNGFENDLKKSDDLVLEVVDFYESFYNSDEYEIISKFDEKTIPFKYFNENDQNQLIDIYVLKNQSSNKNISDNRDYIKKELISKGIRPFDIAIISKKDNKIVEAIECKDFAQMIKYNVTGLPSFYVEKIKLIVKHYEEKQKSNIDLLFIFKDNVDLYEKKTMYFENNKIANYNFVRFEIHNKVMPYGNNIKLLKLNDKLSNNEFMKSFFNNGKYKQMLYSLNSMNNISILFNKKFYNFLHQNFDAKSIICRFVSEKFDLINLEGIYKNMYLVVGNTNHIKILNFYDVEEIKKQKNNKFINFNDLVEFEIINIKDFIANDFKIKLIDLYKEKIIENELNF